MSAREYDIDDESKLAIVCDSPGDKWTVATGPVADAINAMIKLSDSERVEVMDCFCCFCGTLHLPCWCRRDD